MWGRSFLAISAALALCAGCSKSGGGNADGKGGGANKEEPLRIAAASDTKLAFDEVASAFERQTGHKVAVSYAASGLLAKQVAEGAPFDVFASANSAFVDDAVKSGACDGATKSTYAEGHLVVWATDAAHLPKSVDDLRDAKYAKIAIANPEHAPYGTAGKQALEKAGVWEAAEPRVVYGENVAQALQYAKSGNADVALVGLSTAMAAGGAYLAVDPGLHDPLMQALVICKGGAGQGKPNEARAFVDFVEKGGGRAIMKAHGFLMPGETATN